MADNLTTQSATPATVPASSVIATDDVSGVHFQKVKIDVGGDGASAVLGNSNPLPVSDAGGNLSIDDGGNSITVDGTVTASIAAGASTIAKAEDVASADADVGVPAMAVRKATPANTSGTDGDYEMLQMSAGRLWVDPSGVTLTVGSHAVTNAGTFAVQESGSQVQVDDAAFTPATSKVLMAGFEADESSTDSVDEGDGGAARMTLDRKVIVNPQPHTAGGLSTFNATSGDSFTALTNSAQAVKASAGQLYGWYIGNPNTSSVYVVIYNVASGSVTVGTTNPLMVLWVPAGSAANVMGTHGIVFDTAISVAAATTGGGNTAPTTALEVMLFYK